LAQINRNGLNLWLVLASFDSVSIRQARFARLHDAQHVPSTLPPSAEIFAGAPSSHRQTRSGEYS
jgi:hypothetical protein